MSSTTDVLSNWSTLIENFQTSPQQFYSALTQALEKRRMPNARIDRVSFRESHLLSSKREYLRISCKGDFYFAVCGAPFGTGFFISWWLLQPPDGCIAQLFAPFPGLSIIARALVRPWTYYRIDTATMFRTATHQAVLEVIDMITTEKNLPLLSEADRKPVMKGFLA